MGLPSTQAQQQTHRLIFLLLHHCTGLSNLDGSGFTSIFAWTVKKQTQTDEIFSQLSPHVSIFSSGIALCKAVEP